MLKKKKCLLFKAVNNMIHIICTHSFLYSFNLLNLIIEIFSGIHHSIKMFFCSTTFILGIFPWISIICMTVAIYSSFCRTQIIEFNTFSHSHRSMLQLYRLHFIMQCHSIVYACLIAPIERQMHKIQNWIERKSKL